MQILYFHDALCGWCYGFSPVMKSFAAQHAAEVDIEVIAGGMITGPRIGPIGEVAGYIKQAHKDVERRTGVQFGPGFLDGTLEEGTTIFTSVPPAIALAAVKRIAPDKQLAFADAIQTAIYHTGIDPADASAYRKLAEAEGIDGDAFARTFTESSTRKAAEADFELSRRYGVTGFPTVVVLSGDKAAVIARGYVNGAGLERNFLEAKKQF